MHSRNVLNIFRSSSLVTFQSCMFTCCKLPAFVGLPWWHVLRFHPSAYSWIFPADFSQISLKGWQEQNPDEVSVKVSAALQNSGRFRDFCACVNTAYDTCKHLNVLKKSREKMTMFAYLTLTQKIFHVQKLPDQNNSFISVLPFLFAAVFGVWGDCTAHVWRRCFFFFFSCCL